MNTFLSRANNIFAYTLSVLAVLTIGCFLTTACNKNMTDVTIVTLKSNVRRMPDYSANRDKKDLGILHFSLNADFTKVFNWNVKQLFLYITAQYETPENAFNQVVIWDKIIKRGEDANLDYKDIATKYYFFDYSNGLRGNKNVTLTLSWNVIPNAGTLSLVQSLQGHSFQFPEEYTTGYATNK